MKFYIYSSYGVLECEPMTLQAIEKSISQTLSESADSTADSLPEFDIEADDLAETDEE